MYLFICAIVLLAAYKNLPWIWHIRFFRTLSMRLLISPPSPTSLTPECLFLPAISTTRNPLSECDYNIHKSNSTYFTDLDMSRGNLSLLLFSHHPSGILRPHSVRMILGGVQCLFKREIKPYQPFEIWSRVLSWDEKWIYLVSHFVERGAFSPEEYVLQGGRSKKKYNPKGKIFASSVSRYVFKKGRLTYPPEKMLMDCGLLPKSTGEDADMSMWDAIETRRRRDLPAAQLNTGWDAVHDVFEGDIKKALGRYFDTL